MTTTTRVPATKDRTQTSGEVGLTSFYYSFNWQQRSGHCVTYFNIVALGHRWTLFFPLLPRLSLIAAQLPVLQNQRLCPSVRACVRACERWHDRPHRGYRQLVLLGRSFSLLIVLISSLCVVFFAMMSYQPMTDFVRRYGVSEVCRIMLKFVLICPCRYVCLWLHRWRRRCVDSGELMYQCSTTGNNSGIFNGRSATST